MDERGLGPQDIQGAADLPTLPLLTKDDVRANFDELVAESTTRRRLVGAATSGTTGAPLHLLTTPEALAFKWAVWWRHRGRFGFRRKALHAKFITKPFVPSAQTRPPYWRWNRVERQAAIPMQQVVPTKVAAFLDETPFEFYAAYPSILHSLVTLGAETGLELSSGPAVIFSDAERMFADQQEDIEDFTGSRVSQLYGFNEGAGNASMCEESRLHEDFEFGYLEGIDGTVDADTGFREAKIAATGFANMGFPLIRYDVGDIGLWYPDDYECPCGRGSRVLDSVVGRWEDYIVTPDGHQARRLGEIFKEMPQLHQFQIEQSEPGGVTLRLHVKDGYTDADEQLLRRRVGLWISESLAGRFEYVDGIEPGPSGKYQRIINTIGQ